jgi:LPXTG-motif cell wall-anchored protein
MPDAISSDKNEKKERTVTMIFNSLIPPRALATLCGLALAGAIIATPARADLWNKKTILTVNQPIQITDTVLQPGQYVLQLLDSQSDRHIVQIFNRDQTHIINTVIAIPTERLVPTGRTRFTFWETPPGTYKAMRMWYYPGDNYGQEFPYPKHLQQIAMVTPAPPPAPVAEETPAPAPEEPAPPQQAEAQPTPEPQPEVAQNTAPPETPAQTTPEQPAQLPKTGSNYPAIGLAGLALLGLGGLLRLKRVA